MAKSRERNEAARAGCDAAPKHFDGRSCAALRAVILLASLFSGVTPVHSFVVPKNNKYDNKDNKDNKGAPSPVVVRWEEGSPGCTFSRGSDGKYSYGMWSDDVGVVLSVDAREMQIIRHRIEPIFGVVLMVRYRGGSSIEESPDSITLQFMKHFRTTQNSLDPDAYSDKVQGDADALDAETRRAAAKHPEQKESRQARLQEYEKSANELIEFLRTNSLRPARLDRATPEALGWVFFDTNSKWIGSWKEQEEFVLRFPLAGKLFEFPFKLPPERGELLLRKRE